MHWGIGGMGVGREGRLYDKVKIERELKTHSTSQADPSSI